MKRVINTTICVIGSGAVILSGSVIASSAIQILKYQSEGFSGNTYKGNEIVYKDEILRRYEVKTRPPISSLYWEIFLSDEDKQNLKKKRDERDKKATLLGQKKIQWNKYILADDYPELYEKSRCIMFYNNLFNQAIGWTTIGTIYSIPLFIAVVIMNSVI